MDKRKTIVIDADVYKGIFDWITKKYLSHHFEELPSFTRAVNELLRIALKTEEIELEEAREG